MSQKKRGKHGGARPGAGRPRGAKDKLGGRHTDASRKALTLDALARITGTSVADLARATFAAPVGKEAVDEASLRNVKNLVSQRRKEWSSPLVEGGTASCWESHTHRGYAEIQLISDADLPEPPLCPGGEQCPDQIWPWRKHWHCQECGLPDDSWPPRPARTVRWARGIIESTRHEFEGMYFEFRGWFCGECLPKRTASAQAATAHGDECDDGDGDDTQM